ncbi:MAG: VOC family protein [Solibacillus sp.]
MIFAHVAILTNNLENSIKWYKDIFQMSSREIINKENSRYTFLYHKEDKNIQIEVIEKHTNIENNSNSIDHFAFFIDDLDIFIKKFPPTIMNYHSSTPIITATGLKTIFLSGPNKEKIQLIEK